MPCDPLRTLRGDFDASRLAVCAPSVADSWSGDMSRSASFIFCSANCVGFFYLLFGQLHRLGDGWNEPAVPPFCRFRRLAPGSLPEAMKVHVTASKIIREVAAAAFPALLKRSECRFPNVACNSVGLICGTALSLRGVTAALSNFTNARAETLRDGVAWSDQDTRLPVVVVLVTHG